MSVRTAVLGTITLGLGVVLTVLSLYGLPTCHADHWMSCNYLVQVTGTVGAMVALLGLLMFLANPLVVAGMMLGVATMGLMTSLMAGVVIRACASPMMHCHTTTEPVLIGAGVVLILWGLLGWWFGRSAR